MASFSTNERKNLSFQVGPWHYGMEVGIRRSSFASVLAADDMFIVCIIGTRGQFMSSSMNHGYYSMLAFPFHLCALRNKFYNVVP